MENGWLRLALLSFTGLVIIIAILAFISPGRTPMGYMQTGMGHGDNMGNMTNMGQMNGMSMNMPRMSSMNNTPMYNFTGYMGGQMNDLSMLPGMLPGTAMNISSPGIPMNPTPVRVMVYYVPTYPSPVYSSPGYPSPNLSNMVNMSNMMPMNNMSNMGGGGGMGMGSMGMGSMPMMMM